jgi:hypothetical protein
MLGPGEHERTLYEELVQDMDVSGAEVLREAIRELHKLRSRRKVRQAANNTPTETRGLPKAG